MENQETKVAKKSTQKKRTLKTINLQIVVNCGNYETIRLGAEWEPATDDMTAEMLQMDKDLRATAAAILDERKVEREAEIEAKQQQQQQQTAVEAKPKEKITFSHRLYPAILDKVKNGTPLDVVYQYYDVDKLAAGALELAANMYDKQKAQAKNENK